MPLARSTCYSASSCERARLIIPRGNAGRYPNGISWVAIVIAPIIGIAIFWLVHILPKKIAEKKKHPQTKAIQCLCLLSLCFGGLLWRLAWLWAYSKPVLHQLAYGTDVEETIVHHGEAKEEKSEIEQLRARVAELELQASSKGGQS